jgi:hypothetical protein
MVERIGFAMQPMVFKPLRWQYVEWVRDVKDRQDAMNPSSNYRQTRGSKIGHRRL